MGMEQGKWQAHLEAAETSGMSPIAYAAQHGINVRWLYEPKSGSYPVAGRASGGLNGPSVGAILSLT